MPIVVTMPRYLFLNALACFCLCWVFAAALSLSPAAVHASYCSGSLVAEHGLQGVWALAPVLHRLRRCTACQTFLDQGRNWLPAVPAGGLFTTEPPGKPVSSVQSLSRVWLFATPRTATRQASLSITNSQSLLKVMSIESLMPSNRLILCRPLLLPPSIFPSIRVFSNESVPCMRWPKYWSFSFSISPSNEYSGLISFWMDWLDLLAVQRILKSLLQHHSSKASILRHFLYSPALTFIHDYWKTIALTRRTCVHKVMSLLFNMLSRFVRAFLPWITRQSRFCFFFFTRQS